MRPLRDIKRQSPINANKTNITKGYLKPKENIFTSTRELERESGENDVKFKKKNYNKDEMMRKENSVPDSCVEKSHVQSHNENKKEKSERDVPSKKFYFGMEENNNEIKPVNNYLSTNNVEKTNAEHRITVVEKSKNMMNLYKSCESSQDWESSIDKFTANFHKTQIVMANGNTTSCSSSFVSDPDEDVSVM